MKRLAFAAFAALALTAATAATAAAADPIKIADVAELSGPGASAGKAWDDAIKMGVEEINADGGVLGRKIALTTYDTQTDAQMSRAMVQKAIDNGAFMLLGTVYSSSTIVNMMVAQQNGIPQISGSSAPAITQRGNPWIFRSELDANTAVANISQYIAKQMGIKKIAVEWANDAYGKPGRDAFVKDMKKYGVDVVADISSEVGQADFSADVSKLKSSGAQALFVYLHEEESARLLRELAKQGNKLPIIGDTTLLDSKVIQLAGPAANGIMGADSLTIEAPGKQIKEFGDNFEKKYGYTATHNAMKGYIAIYAAATAIKRAGKLDRQKVADILHTQPITVKEVPQILVDCKWSKNGDISHESFLVKVKDGKEVVVDTIPAS